MQLRLGQKKRERSNSNSNWKKIYKHILTRIFFTQFDCNFIENSTGSTHAFWTSSKFCGNICLSDLYVQFIENRIQQTLGRENEKTSHFTKLFLKLLPFHKILQLKRCVNRIATHMGTYFELHWHNYQLGITSSISNLNKLQTWQRSV